MSKDSRKAAKSAIARLCEWRGLNCYEKSKRKEDIFMENTVNKRILDLCKERGYTIYRLSALSGIPTSTITSILKRNNAPTIPTLQKICKALDLTLAQFFSEGFETLTKTQSEYLSEFSKLNSHERELVLSYIRGINDSKSGKRRGR